MYWAIEKNAMDKILAIIAASDKFGEPEISASIGHAVEHRGGVAVIPVSGTLMKNPSFIEKLFFGATDMAEIQDSIMTAAANKDISGIVLNISSPGGTVAGTPELAESVKAANQKKPVVAYVDDLAASAAYWIASQAESIYASRQAVVGSIGVRMAMYDMSKAYEQAGIKVIPIDTGKFKSAGLAGTEISDEQKQMYQDIVDAHFSEFKSAVIKGRGMDDNTWDKVKDAQVFHASKAKSARLIDGISTLSEVIKEIGRTSGRSTKAAHERLRLYADA
ncbi:MAG: signal peptide peptidase SppA [Chlorobiaceae bacterium]|nr:signal peptide peptidase SppA [Chlorobiaceae bacterium]